jgi:transcriptional regulator with XRE-family HTH domain
VRLAAGLNQRYLNGYHLGVSGSIIKRARRGSGLSQRELARRSGTSQSTLSTYEHGTKSPTLAVAERIVHTTGYALDLVPRVSFTVHVGARGEPFVVPDQLWRLNTVDALATVILPQHLHWSGKSRAFRLRDRRDRARVYEIVLREGEPGDLLTFIDGALLVDIWDDLVVPVAIREAWKPLLSGVGEVA